MEGYISLFVAFLSGFCFHIMWNRLVNLGTSIIMIKKTMIDCLLMLAQNIQSVYEVNSIKQEAWKLMERDEKYIEFQKAVDKREITSLQNTVIRNFINSVPPRYNHLIEFRDWASALKYIDKIIKEEK